MTHRRAIVVVAMVVAALVGVGLMIVPSSPLHQTPTLGLDLQGGLEITKQAVPPKGRELTQEDLDRSVTIMRDRVDRLGVSEPEIRTQGDDQITIQLPGVKDPEAAAKIIGKTAQLELFDLETSLVSPSVDINGNPQPRDSVYALLAGQQSLVDGESDQWWLFNDKKKLVAGPVSTKEKALNKYDGEAARRVQAPRDAEGHGRHLVRRPGCGLPRIARPRRRRRRTTSSSTRRRPCRR